MIGLGIAPPVIVSESGEPKEANGTLIVSVVISRFEPTVRSTLVVVSKPAPYTVNVFFVPGPAPKAYVEVVPVLFI